MVGLLILNVTTDGREQGSTDAERSVALLPDKQAARLSHPSRGIALDRIDGLSQILCRRELNQAMNMIVRAADRVDEDSFVFAGAGDVGPQVRLQGLVDQFRAVFCAEDEVDDVPAVTVRHCAAPLALPYFHGTVPSADALG